MAHWLWLSSTAWLKAPSSSRLREDPIERRRLRSANLLQNRRAGRDLTRESVPQLFRALPEFQISTATVAPLTPPKWPISPPPPSAPSAAVSRQHTTKPLVLRTLPRVRGHGL